MSLPILSPLVSVCIASYNHARFMDSTIKSVLNQTYTNWELIIVDDCSTDNSRALLRQYELDYPEKIKIIFAETNSGPSISSNRAMLAAQGEYIALLGSDDMMHPERLAKQVDFLQKNPAYPLLFTEVFVIDDQATPESVKTEPVLYKHPVFSTPIDNIRSQLIRSNFLNAPSVLMHRKLIDEVGLFNPELIYVQDFDYWMRVLDRYEVYRMEEALTFYRVHGKNLSITSFENISFGAQYESVIIILRAIQRWSKIPFTLEKLFTFKQPDDGSPERQLEELHAKLMLIDYAIKLEQGYLGQETPLSLGIAYSLALEAIDFYAYPKDEYQVVFSYLYSLLGDTERTAGRRSLSFQKYLRQREQKNHAEKTESFLQLYQRFNQKHLFNEESFRFLMERQKQWRQMPRLVFIFEATQQSSQQVSLLINSLLTQFYTHWELAILVDTDQYHVLQAQYPQANIIYYFAHEFKSFSKFVREMAILYADQAETWLSIVPSNMMFNFYDALWMLADYINTYPQKRLFYTDNDFVQVTGENEFLYLNATFRTGFDPILFEQAYVLGAFLLLKIDLFAQALDLVEKITDPNQWVQAALEIKTDTVIGHLPEPLVHLLDKNPSQIKKTPVFQPNIFTTTKITCLLFCQPDLPSFQTQLYALQKTVGAQPFQLILLNCPAEFLPLTRAYSSWELEFLPYAPEDVTDQQRVISAIRGEVTCFLTLNAFPEANWLEETLKAWSQSPNIGMVGGQINVFDHQNQRLYFGSLTRLDETGCPLFLTENDLISDDQVARYSYMQAVSLVNLNGLSIKTSLLRRFSIQINTPFLHETLLCAATRAEAQTILWNPASQLRSRTLKHTITPLSWAQLVYLYTNYALVLQQEQTYPVHYSVTAYEKLESYFVTNWVQNLTHPKMILLYHHGSLVFNWLMDCFHDLQETGQAQTAAFPIFQEKNAVLTGIQLYRNYPDSIVIQSGAKNFPWTAIRDLKLLRPDTRIIYYIIGGIQTVLSEMYYIDIQHLENQTVEMVVNYLQPYLGLIDVLWVENEKMVELFTPFFPVVKQVSPCFLPSQLRVLEALPPEPAPPEKFRLSEKIRVAYLHTPYSEKLTQFACDLIAATKEEVEWLVLDGQLVEQGATLIQFEGENLTHSLKKLGLDAAIYLTEETSFGESDSLLPLLQYGLAEIPVICSQSAIYADLPILALPPDQNTWRDLILSIQDNPAQFALLASQILDFLLEKYTLPADFFTQWLD